MITLNTIIHTIVHKAKELPNIGTVVLNDIYELNSMQNVEYSVFGITQNQHYYDTQNQIMYYSFNLFYADRLTENKQDEIDAQSLGIQLLHYLVQELEETTQLIVVNNYTFNTFQEKFQSLTAGAYVNVTFGVPDDCITL